MTNTTVNFVTVFAATFGPRNTERKLEQMNRSGALGRHSSCWVNDYDCGDQCPVGHHDGQPVATSREGVQWADVTAARFEELLLSNEILRGMAGDHVVTCGVHFALIWNEHQDEVPFENAREAARWFFVNCSWDPCAITANTL